MERVLSKDKAKTNLTKTLLEDPTLSRRTLLKLGVLAGGLVLLKPADKLFATNIWESDAAQSSKLTAEEVRGWMSNPSDYKSAPWTLYFTDWLGGEMNKTISPKLGTSSLLFQPAFLLGKKLCDIGEELKKIGVEKLSGEARIAYVCISNNRDQITKYIITDTGANGLLELSIMPSDFPKPLGNFDIWSRSVARNDIKITPDMSFSCFSFAVGGEEYSPLAAVLDKNLNLKIFDFGNSTVTRMNLSSAIFEKNPRNSQVVIKQKNGGMFIAITAKNFEYIYVFKYTQPTKDVEIKHIAILSFYKFEESHLAPNEGF